MGVAGCAEHPEASHSRQRKNLLRSRLAPEPSRAASESPATYGHVARLVMGDLGTGGPWNHNKDLHFREDACFQSPGHWLFKFV